MADLKPESSSDYRPIFGVEMPKDKNKKPIPKWVPVALLAVSSAALVVPIVMLRRHRAATLGKALAETPPPPARRTVSKGVPIANPTTKPPLFSIRDPVPSTSASSAASGAPKSEDNFNGALHCAKAFSIATLFVGIGAAATVYGVRQYMGVQTTQEFADRMRNAILTRMPILSARIHRPPQIEDGDSPPPPNPPLHAAAEITEEWSWPAAERRLTEAFDKDGFYGWVAAAMHELEAEGRIERAKRGHV